MDKVFITGLKLQALIGVYEFERHAKQSIVIDIELDADLRRAGTSDNVADTLDYGAIAKRLEQIADASSYSLLEALAEEMTSTLMREFAISKIKLKINKPDILSNVSAVGIEILREQNLHATPPSACRA